MRYKKIKYKNFASQRRFGVELEMGNEVSKPKIKSLIKAFSSHDCYVTRYQLSPESDFWHIKEDSTCGVFGKEGPKGIEIASFVAQGTRDLIHIANIADYLRALGCKVNDNCGFHIHAEAVDLSHEDVGKILAYWVKIEKTITRALPSRRLRSEYCRLLGECEYSLVRKSDLKNVYEFYKPIDLSFFENEDRRVNLNIVNYCRSEVFPTNKRKTLELRCPEGTLDSRDIRCWVKLFLGFIDNCKNLPTPIVLNDANIEETLYILGLSHDKDFYILDPDLFEVKTWFLERILKYNNESLYNSVFGKSDNIKHAKNILNLMHSPFNSY